MWFPSTSPRAIVFDTIVIDVEDAFNIVLPVTHVADKNIPYHLGDRSVTGHGGARFKW